LDRPPFFGSLGLSLAEQGCDVITTVSVMTGLGVSMKRVVVKRQKDIELALVHAGTERPGSLA